MQPGHIIDLQISSEEKHMNRELLVSFNFCWNKTHDQEVFFKIFTTVVNSIGLFRSNVCIAMFSTDLFAWAIQQGPK